jgi:hypothetical protein
MPQGVAVAPRSGGPRLRRSEEAQVLADAPDQHRRRRQAAQDRLVGVTAVDGDDHPALRSPGALVQRAAHLRQRRQPAGAEVLPLTPPAVVLPQLRRIGLLGMRQRRGMLVGHRNAARRPGSQAGVQRRRDLQEALRPHQVAVEVRRERIAAIACPGNVGAGLLEVGVIHGQHQRRPCGQPIQQAGQHHPKEPPGLPVIGGIQAVIGRPVHRLASGGAEEIGDGVPPQAQQLADPQAAGPAEGADLAKGIHALPP